MKILLATDGSDFSSAAIEKCCEIINLKNAWINVVSTVESAAQVAAEPFNVSADYVREIDAAARNQAAEYVSQAENLIRRRFPDSTIELTHKVAMGSPERIILEEAEAFGADLIVMGSHGRGFWGRMFLGSVSQSIVLHARCSVLIVRTSESMNGKH